MAPRRGLEVIEMHALFQAQRLPEFEAFAVVAAVTDDVKLADAKGDKIVQDRARGAGLRPHAA